MGSRVVHDLPAPELLGAIHDYQIAMSRRLRPHELDDHALNAEALRTLMQGRQHFQARMVIAGRRLEGWVTPSGNLLITLIDPPPGLPASSTGSWRLDGNSLCARFEQWHKSKEVCIRVVRDDRDMFRLYTRDGKLRLAAQRLGSGEHECQGTPRRIYADIGASVVTIIVQSINPFDVAQIGRAHV